MATPETGRRTPFSDAELDEFRALILSKRDAALEEIEQMRAQLKDDQESGGDSAYSFHMADAGTDAMEREKLYLMISRQQKFVRHLERALERIENKTYGICKVTGKPIGRERLLAVPHTETSIEAKLKEKRP
ncbi:MAG: TraR/DksA family transcriptional regulator [Rubricoccaceae bacterium]